MSGCAGLPVRVARMKRCQVHVIDGTGTTGESPHLTGTGQTAEPALEVVAADILDSAEVATGDDLLRLVEVRATMAEICHPDDAPLQAFA